MVRIFLLCAAISAVGSAADLSLTIGPPVAAGPGVKATKTKAVFAVRMEGCDDLADAHLSATAEGLVDGTRSSLRGMPVGAGSPGVYLVAEFWPMEGIWAVSLAASCGAVTAGAIVPVSNQGFVRGLIKLFPHPPTQPEIQQALFSADKELMKKP